MNNHRFFSLFLTPCILLLLALPSYAKAPLWKISKSDNFLYIGGTIHLLKSSDFPLPEAFELAYKKSAQIIFETDLQQAQTTAFQALVIEKVAYKNDDTLENHIKPATFKRLKKYLDKTGIPLAMINGFKPGMAMTMLSIFELKKLGLTGEGVDKFYNDKAVSDHKSLGKLETIEKQIDTIANMGNKDPDGFINYSLNDLNNLPSLFDELKSAWRTGDLKKLTELGITPMKKQYPSAYQSILVERNKAWVPKIKKMLETKEIEMVLVGALHLAGNDSVLAQLKSDGYTIEQF